MCCKVVGSDICVHRDRCRAFADWSFGKAGWAIVFIWVRLWCVVYVSESMGEIRISFEIGGFVFGIGYV